MDITNSSEHSLTLPSPESQASPPTDLYVNPFDGWHAELVDSAPNIDLMLQVMGDGESVEAVNVMSFPMTVVGRGQAELFLMVFTSLCRFMNAGGNLFKFADQLAKTKISQMASDYHIEYPPGWELMSVLQDVSEPTIVLANEQTSKVLVVVEDQRSELMDLEDLPEQIV